MQFASSISGLIGMWFNITLLKEKFLLSQSFPEDDAKIRKMIDGQYAYKGVFM
jgi:hypothetical protein